MSKTRQYITVEGELHSYEYNYDHNHIKKVRAKCPTCGTLLISVSRSNPNYKPIGKWCEFCNSLFLLDSFSKIFKVKIENV